MDYLFWYFFSGDLKSFHILQCRIFNDGLLLRVVVILLAVQMSVLSSIRTLPSSQLDGGLSAPQLDP